MKKKSVLPSARVIVTRTNRWLQLPKDIRSLIVQGQKRIERLLQDISRTAKVKFIPPVRIVDCAWVSEDNAVFGKATSMKIGDTTFVGVELPATTAAYVDDEKVLRGLLLHEIAHCYYFYWMMIVHLEENIPIRNEPTRLTLPQSNKFSDEAEFDKEIMIRPEDWFSADDAKLLFHQQDEILRPFVSKVENDWITRSLPFEMVNRHFHMKAKFTIPLELEKHVRFLLSTKNAEESNQHEP